ncbi:MAG: DUF433 domain-containing protein [Acidobacteriota bacterium]|nr:DUF433 domain-containing protein [Acidobacteriota bacterium]
MTRSDAAGITIDEILSDYRDLEREDILAVMNFKD